MTYEEDLRDLADLLAQMNAEQLLIFRAILISGQGQAWRAIDGATIERLREWIMIGDDRPDE